MDPDERAGSEHLLTREELLARVRADGTLSSSNALGEHRGSIHQVGAAVQGAPACNGWTFWHIEVEGARRPIDHLRQQVRAGL